MRVGVPRPFVPSVHAPAYWASFDFFLRLSQTTKLTKDALYQSQDFNWNGQLPLYHFHPQQ
jgi:hypothetical protein